MAEVSTFDWRGFALVILVLGRLALAFFDRLEEKMEKRRRRKSRRTPQE